MDAFAALDEQAQLDHLADVARRALPFWGLDTSCELRLLSLSENATYAVETAQGRAVMRVHRTGYHSLAAIDSELQWMRALQSQAGICTPQARPGVDGQYIASVKTASLAEERQVVMFDWIAGEAPDESQLLAPFERLGRVTAALHQHARQWSQPSGFTRLRWDFAGCLGPDAHWGDWRDGPGLSFEAAEVLQHAVDLLQARLIAFGEGPERFGLIHADLRLANLLEVDGETRVIDFDDAGFGWFLYDLAGALSFIETRDDVPALITSWLRGYEGVQPLSAEEKTAIPGFILLRRLTLLAWIASHSETELAASQGREFTEGTLLLALHYLESDGARVWCA